MSLLAPRSLALLALLALVGSTVAACATDVTLDGTEVVADDDEGEENVLLSDPDVPDRFVFAGTTTVGAIARTACSTAGARALSEQLLAEVECMRPGTLSSIASIPGLSLNPGVLSQLNKGAASALRAAVAGSSLSINSAVRSTAQQYILYYWYQNGRCTNVVSLAAKPGRSNHESGLAIDTSAYASWKSRLAARGFRWLGSSDPVHFDYAGAGAVDIRSLAVKAFQRLWNRNNPGDRIAEDGAWGPTTAAKMDRAPAGGFTVGAQCGGAGTPTPPPATAKLQGVIYQGNDTSARIGAATVTLSNGRATTADASGLYTFDNLAPGSFTVTARASGFRTATVNTTVAAGTSNWGSVGLTRAIATGLLKGVVYRGNDTGARIAGATVRVSTGETATTDASGVYSIASVGVGSVTITASKAGFTPRVVTRTIAANSDNWGSVGLSTGGTALVDACGEVSTAGACDGDVVRWCNQGDLVTVDCSAHGETCGWNAAEGYADCQ
jgi:Carboxypeptidase regulatory-like domain/D-alanyl-D-alanine carboxypeptidase